MNSKMFADKMMPFLQKYINYSDRDKHKVHYGLEVIYILITKMILITIFSLFLGITKEMYIFLLFYSLLRMYSSGIHLSTSLGCTIFSSVMLLGFTELALNTHMLLEQRIVISGLVMVLFALYSPADTIKKPLIHEEKRKSNKIISSFICYIYLLLIFLIKDSFILNCITYSMILQTILICPATYKLFKQPYNNYMNYRPDL